MSHKPAIVFLCTGNSCRSQMAEGWLRHLKGDKFEAYSAGTEPHGLNPNAVRVMAEAGMDISRQQSRLLADINVEPDIVFTVCDQADKTCPVLPATTRKIHIGFDDPPKLAAAVDTEQEKLQCYRTVRDAIKSFVENIECYM